jgi:hypothetical protein
MSEENNEVKLLNINGLVESLKVLRVVLDKSVKNGGFDNLNDSYVAKISLDNMEIAIKNLNTHQAKYLENNNLQVAGATLSINNSVPTDNTDTETE